MHTLVSLLRSGSSSKLFPLTFPFADSMVAYVLGPGLCGDPMYANIAADFCRDATARLPQGHARLPARDSRRFGRGGMHEHVPLKEANMHVKLLMLCSVLCVSIRLYLLHGLLQYQTISCTFLIRTKKYISVYIYADAKMLLPLTKALLVYSLFDAICTEYAIRPEAYRCREYLFI